MSHLGCNHTVPARGRVSKWVSFWLAPRITPNRSGATGQWREAQDLNLRTACAINGLAIRRYRPTLPTSHSAPFLLSFTRGKRGNFSRPVKHPHAPIAVGWWTGLESNQPLRIFSPPLSPFELPVQSLRRVPFPRRTTFGWDNAPPIPLRIHHTDMLCNASCREIAFFGAVPAS